MLFSILLLMIYLTPDLTTQTEDRLRSMHTVQCFLTYGAASSDLQGRMPCVNGIL